MVPHSFTFSLSFWHQILRALWDNIYIQIQPNRVEREDARVQIVIWKAIYQTQGKLDNTNSGLIQLLHVYIELKQAFIKFESVSFHFCKPKGSDKARSC